MTTTTGPTANGRINNTMVQRKRTKRHTIPWSKEKEQKDIQYQGPKKKNKKTYNTMVQRKRTKRHTIPWSKEKEQKDIQYYGPKKKNKKTYNTMV
jgi:hypothetical protein